MKKKRYLPFGYEMIHGQYVVVQEEQHLIQDIFSQYLAGASLQQLAYAAERTGIKFRENTDKWNKNMISRILEDDRYWRGSPFPEIITPQTAWKAMKLKAEKTATKSEITFLRRKLICCQCFKVLHRNGKSKPNIYWDCPNCGMRVGPFSDQELLCAVTQKILTLCREPEKIVPDPVLNQTIPIQVIRLTNEINQMLDQREVDPERALTLILECAAEKYHSCQVQALDYQTLKIQKLLEAHIHDESLDQQLFEQIVEKVILHPGGSVQLQLVNHKII